MPAPCLVDLNQFATHDKYHCFDKDLNEENSDELDLENSAASGDFNYQQCSPYRGRTALEKGIDGESFVPLTANLAPLSQETIVGSPQLRTKRSSRSDTDDQTLAPDTSIVSTGTMDLSGDQSELLKTRSGTLRKYGRLNFDTEDQPSVCFDENEDEDFAPGSGPSSSANPASQDVHFELGSPSSVNDLGSPRSRKKLRKKIRPESSIPLVAQSPPPVYDLPAGLEQIGMGIGYTRPAESHHARLSMSSLTPRTCHALFSNSRLPYFKQDPRKTGSRQRVEQSSPGGVMNGVNASEDQMDAVMREIYGSTWELGLSSTDVSAAAAAAGSSKAKTGLGLSDSVLAMPNRAYYPAPPPAELLTMSPDCTLRLVTPSTTSLAQL